MGVPLNELDQAKRGGALTGRKPPPKGTTAPLPSGPSAQLIADQGERTRLRTSPSGVSARAMYLKSSSRVTSVAA
jgi:hypothetical protein